MKNTIILTERQLKNVVKFLAEQRFRNFKSPLGLEIDSDEQELLNNAMNEYGAKSPRQLYNILLQDRENAERFSSYRSVDISKLIGILEYYWNFDKPDVYLSPRRKRGDEPTIEPENKPEERKPSFSDRFRFNKGDITKFRDE
jgi:hypothetical protein